MTTVDESAAPATTALSATSAPDPVRLVEASEREGTYHQAADAVAEIKPHPGRVPTISFGGASTAQAALARQDAIAAAADAVA